MTLLVGSVVCREIQSSRSKYYKMGSLVQFHRSGDLSPYEDGARTRVGVVMGAVAGKTGDKRPVRWMQEIKQRSSSTVRWLSHFARYEEEEITLRGMTEYGPYECPSCSSQNLVFYIRVVSLIDQLMSIWPHLRLRCTDCSLAFDVWERAGVPEPPYAEPGSGWLGGSRDRSHRFYEIRDRGNARRRNGLPRICDLCGSGLNKRKYRSIYYCSKDCADEHWNLQWGPLSKVKLRQANHRCQVCDSRASDVHHKTPACLGGTSEDDNLVVLCYLCHRKAHRGLQRELHKVGKENQILNERLRRSLGLPPRMIIRGDDGTRQESLDSLLLVQ